MFNYDRFIMNILPRPTDFNEIGKWLNGFGMRTPLGGISRKIRVSIGREYNRPASKGYTGSLEWINMQEIIASLPSGHSLHC
jgi:hypothetical protein